MKRAVRNLVVNVGQDNTKARLLLILMSLGMFLLGAGAPSDIGGMG